jgi:hypothetical protein
VASRYPLGEAKDAVRFWCRPPGRVFHSILTLLGAFTAWSVSVPGWHFDAAMLAVGAWCLAALVWAVRVAATAVLRCPRGSLLRWVGGPAIGCVTLALVRLDLPQRARFAASRAALERAAADVLSSAHHAPEWFSGEELRIGWFDVRYRDAIPGGVRFWIDGGFIDPVGLAFAPHGVPPDGSYGRYWPIQGAWFGFTVDF